MTGESTPGSVADAPEGVTREQIDAATVVVFGPLDLVRVRVQQRIASAAASIDAAVAESGRDPQLRQALEDGLRGAQDLLIEGLRTTVARRPPPEPVGGAT